MRRFPSLSPGAFFQEEVQAVPASPSDAVDDRSPGHPLDVDALMLRLSQYVQTPHRQTEGIVERICEEIEAASQGYLHLLLQKDSLHETTLPLHGVLSLPVQTGERLYGTLIVMPDPLQPESFPLPRMKAQVLAEWCAFLFYRLEVTTFLCTRVQPPAYQLASFTRREQEVLNLLCRRYSTAEIAQALSISPETVRKHRERIYARLAVENEYDALVAAFTRGLYFPAERLSPRLMLSRKP